MSATLQTKWTIPLLDADDGSSDAFICLPDELLESLGWSEGDELTVDIVGNSIRLIKEASS